MEAHERKTEPVTRPEAGPAPVPMRRLLAACAAADAVSTPPGPAPVERGGGPEAPEVSEAPPGSGRRPAEDGGQGAEAA
ncbi:hypothetical protein V1L54_14350 [Streptomyces sp. TRM 70361]|uniref:hypothetical protein n=1 Tax=Streptomyces sp. TRM 70361 TaxID=3116553 RepID=UPI002E7BA628|nr:hypothetical protein [Streptomyces sp. TRM 70361]MEE1940574.1 hypothetical protein [Streptomyces sp. TRM 70361]